MKLVIHSQTEGQVIYPIFCLVYDYFSLLGLKLIQVMPQSHHTPGPRTGCSPAGPGLFLTKVIRPLMGPTRAPCGSVRMLSPRTGPVEFQCMHHKLAGPVRVWYYGQTVNSLCGDRTDPVRPNTTPVRDFCLSWLWQFPYVSVRAPHGILTGHARDPYGSRRIWKTLKIPVRVPYDARAVIARGTRGVRWIIQPNHKYADVSSRTGLRP